MSPKAIWFTTIGISSLTLIAAVPLSQAAAKLWKPEVAHAAKVTIHLVKNKSLSPIVLSRRSQVTPLVQSVQLRQASAETPGFSGLNQQFSLSYPALVQSTAFSESLAGKHRFHQKAANYQIAAQEYQQLLDSSKMTD